MDTTEDDDVGIGFRSDAGKSEGVACVIGNILNLRQLVVVRKNYGIAFAGEALNLLGPALICNYATVAAIFIDYRFVQIRFKARQAGSIGRKAGIHGKLRPYFNGLWLRPEKTPSPLPATVPGGIRSGLKRASARDLSSQHNIEKAPKPGRILTSRTNLFLKIVRLV